MSWLAKITFHLKSLLAKGKLDAQLTEEVRTHVDMATEANVAAGMTLDEARYAALREFGNVAHVQERTREERGWVWLEQFWQDLRYAGRALRKNPSFTITAGLTLALGIGVNAGLFTFYNAVAMRSLPVSEPDELVLFRRTGSKSNPRFSYRQYLDYREGVTAFSGLVAWFEAPMVWDDPTGRVDPLLSAEGRNGVPGGVFVQFVSENYFSLLGAGIHLGRGFRAEENHAPQSHPVIVLSHLFWERQLHRDPGVLGATLSFSGMKLTVIGVAAPEFVGHQPAPPAGWVPFMMAMQAEALGRPEVTPFALFGRLKPGVSVRQASEDVRLVAERLRDPTTMQRGRVQAPALDPGMKFVNFTYDAKTVSILTPIVLGFLMVLAIACTNVANLLFARGVMRQQEIGVRLSLGASRGRVVRQLLTENLLLCLLGTIGGIIVSQWTLATILKGLPASWGRAGEMRQWRALEIGVDHRVLGWAALLTLVAALTAGLTPALHAARANLLSALKAEPTVFGLRLSQSGLRHLLVITQVAICVMLLSCAGLLGRNLFVLRTLDPGFDPRAVYQSLAGPKVRPAKQTEVIAATRQAMETARSLPGVASACAVATAPMLGLKGLHTTQVTALDSGRSDPAPQTMRYGVVSAEYFATFAIPLPRGRAFTPREVELGAPVAVITESAARQLWPGEAEVVGRTLAVSESAFWWDSKPRAGERQCAVVGVIRDLRSSVTDDRQAFVFLPLTPGYGTPGNFYLRPRSDSAAALAGLKNQADALGVALQIEGTVASRLEEYYAPFVVLAWLSGVLGGLALLMAVVGLYGVMAFLVSQRGREISIRIALGAGAGKVIGLFLRQGMKLVALGMIAGLIGGGLFALVLRRILFGLESAFDPLAFGFVTVVLALVALFACWLPARRAARADPMIALRAE